MSTTPTGGLQPPPKQRSVRKPKVTQQKALVPPASEIAKLTLEQTTYLLDTVDRINEREVAHGTHRMLIAAGCFVSCIGSFTYLTMYGHATAAGIILGTSVMGVIAQMINARL